MPLQKKKLLYTTCAHGLVTFDHTNKQASKQPNYIHAILFGGINGPYLIFYIILHFSII